MKFIFSLILFLSPFSASAMYDCAALFDGELQLSLNQDVAADLMSENLIYSADSTVAIRIRNVVLTPPNAKLQMFKEKLQANGSYTLTIKGARHEVLNQLILVSMQARMPTSQLRKLVEKFVEAYPISRFTEEVLAAKQILELK